MKLFDLHCDTPYELFKGRKSLEANDLHVSLNKAAYLEKYVQCAAIWSDSRLCDAECLQLFLSASDYFKKQAPFLIRCADDLEASCKDSFILSVEDSRLISNDTDNIDLLYSIGVRVMTLLWGQKSSVGCAWDESGPLTALGKEALERCFSVGIIPCVSHANDEAISYILERAAKNEKPVIATHSDSRAICPTMRNLTDDHAKRIAHLGGIIGISLYPPHLRGEKADISDIIKHIQHYVSICGEGAVCLGCDLDGIDIMPEGILDISSLPLLFDRICTSFGTRCAEDVFFNNAYNFFKNNLPQ